MSMKLILLGAPGAGKGTQAAILSEKFSIPAISTGAILRTAIREQTEVGRVAQEYMKDGKLVPDEVVIDIILARLQEADCENGFILDGVPRTTVQALALEAAGIKIDKVLSIEIEDEEIIARMSGRRVCEECASTYHVVSKKPSIDGKCDRCGARLVLRDDDKAETVRNRLQIYYKQTAPLKEFYSERGVLVTIENQPDIPSTTVKMMEALHGE